MRAVLVDGQPVDCDDVVIAGGTWSADLLNRLGVRVRMQAGKGYSFTVEPADRAAADPSTSATSMSLSRPSAAVTRIAGTMEFSGNNRRLDWRRVEAIATQAANISAAGSRAATT